MTPHPDNTEQVRSDPVSISGGEQERLTLIRCAHCKHVFRNPDHDEDCECPWELTLSDEYEEAWEVVEVQMVRVLRVERADA